MEAKSLTNYSHLFLSSLLIVSILPTSLATKSTEDDTIVVYKNYIRSTCNSTLYPKDCYMALSSYASVVKSDPEKLCDAALNVTLSAACNTSSVIKSLSKLKGLSRNETVVIKDCMENVMDSIYRLKESLKAMANLHGPDRKFQLDNVRTWSSAALSDETTCSDELDEMSVGNLVKKKIGKSVLKLSRMTSNFLALLNYLGQ